MRAFYKTFLLALAVSLMVPATAVVLLSAIKMKPTLLPIEKQVLGFSFLLPPSMEKKHLTFDNLRNPIGADGKEYPPIALAELAPAQGSPADNQVSLIVVGKTTKLAVLKGTVVREGDVFQGTRVVRIQKDGVLLKNGKEEKWLAAK